MSFGDVATRGEGEAQGDTGLGPLSERLSLGVAARLSRYLQVLTQARKMGKETISSQELSEYTHVNSTQIRRDLSGFGKFGKRGVGYNVDSLVSQIRKILRTSGQHNIALFGAGTSAARSPPRTSSPTTASASWRSSTPTAARWGRRSTA
jgi:redox-sensing transcriptional repressor